MKSLDVIEVLRKNISQSACGPDSLLRNTFILTDPYRQMENALPFILIEEGSTQIISNPQGLIYEYLHTIEISCVVNAAKEEWEIYKRKCAELADAVLDSIAALQDYRFKVFPREMKPGELITGGMKCSGIKITLEVKTLYKEEQ